MKTECEVIRDLLPLYADEVCSEGSRHLIDEHLQECPDCSAVLEKIRTDELEAGLREEKDQVIEYRYWDGSEPEKEEEEKKTDIWGD